jgi:hypothetical protein
MKLNIKEVERYIYLIGAMILVWNLFTKLNKIQHDIEHLVILEDMGVCEGAE